MCDAVLDYQLRSYLVQEESNHSNSLSFEFFSLNDVGLLFLIITSKFPIQVTKAQSSQNGLNPLSSIGAKVWNDFCTCNLLSFVQ